MKGISCRGRSLRRKKHRKAPRLQAALRAGHFWPCCRCTAFRISRKESKRMIKFKRSSKEIPFTIPVRHDKIKVSFCRPPARAGWFLQRRKMVSGRAVRRPFLAVPVREEGSPCNSGTAPAAVTDDWKEQGRAIASGHWPPWAGKALVPG